MTTRRNSIPPKKRPTRDHDAPNALAPLTRYNPAKIVAKEGKNPLGEFVLALALAFNDLKGLIDWRQRIFPLKPSDEGELSPRAGEWAGIETQIHRLLVAQMHELLKLIKEFESVASGEAMRKILKKASSSTRHDWADLVKVATGKGATRDTDFAQVLVETRNNTSYHYHQPKGLVAGFRRCFFYSPRTPRNEVAFASVGLNMEQSRFYFADAAVEAAVEILADKTMGSAKFGKRLTAAIESVNQALAHIVSAYIKQARVS